MGVFRGPETTRYDKSLWGVGRQGALRLAPELAFNVPSGRPPVRRLREAR